MPDSISKLWSLNLSFLYCTRIFLSLTVSRYVSYVGFLLKDKYKRALGLLATCDIPYNGSRLNGKATSGLEGRVPQLQKASLAASKSLLFSFVLDTFQAISVNFFNSSDTRRRNIRPMDVQVNKICDFTIHQWNLPEISRRFTPKLDLQMPMWS